MSIAIRRFSFRVPAALAAALFAAAAAAVSVPAARAGDLFSIPMHGNWCGPNHPSNALEASYPPIDPLDDACRAHDVCYAARGYGSCRCDLAFMATLRRMPYPNPMVEEKARAIYDAVGLMPCDDPVSSVYKQERVWSDLASDAASGRRAPWELPMRFAKLGLTVMENKLRRGW